MYSFLMVFEMQRAYNCIAVCSLMRQFSGLVLFGQLLGMPGIHIMLHTLQEAYLHLQRSLSSLLHQAIFCFLRRF
ncbi:hypothetical protein OIU77_026639 [Salix suchowensis]|uniref:Uncharacterized protein n=1 Tax=Salix suchowensis TaxID=1278906 RepID=A0ABQ9BM28_9ROSI|nr:hypothetical protein OIU77_026639 [Salix suchowensis]